MPTDGKVTLDRSVLPMEDRPFKGTANRTLKGSKPDFPSPVEAPEAAPNVLLVLIDDAGFGNPSTFGGPVSTPTFERCAQNGLRYNRNHVTALCSPCRAALLSGRNHHAVGFGSIAETASGFPGYNALWPKSAASGARILRDNGYSTAAFGKWHMSPIDQQGPAGPFDRWPSGLGFDYYWGFVPGESSQYDTVITENNTYLGPGSQMQEDFYFPDAMGDKAIEWIRGQKSHEPEKPFFIYFSTGCSHAPHHVTTKWSDKYKGKFDQGWDKLREETFARQKKLGVIPPDAQLTPRAKEFPAWDSLSADERALYSRQMEVYAGYQENADWNVGRVIQAIDDMGMLDNTLIIWIFGDNGASMEGTPTGCVNEMTVLNGVPLTAEQQLQMAELYGGAEKWGGPVTDPHYSCAWAWAGNTPFQWGKQIASHLGGTRDAMVVSWPQRIKDKGGLRSQFTHVIDVVPTILEAAGIPAPKTVDGIEQMPMHGVSFAYTFDDAKAAERHTQQYFEIFGNRAMYKDGWIASCRLDRPPWGLDPGSLAKFAPDVYDPEKDTWELYNLNDDFSQANDVAQKNPEKLNELKALFWQEAEKYNVTPLMGGLAVFWGFLPSAGAAKTKYTFYPGVQNVPQGLVPHVFGTSYAIEADLEIPASGCEGAIVANCDFLGGFSLYVQNGKLHHTYAFLGIPPTPTGRPHPILAKLLEATGKLAPVFRSYTLTSSEPMPTGHVIARFEFIADERKQGTGGQTRLLVNGKVVGEGRLEHTVPVIFSAYACMDIGRDNEKPVSWTYKSPFVFTGTIKTVTFDLEPKGPTSDAERTQHTKDREQTKVMAGVHG
ncbi:MAG: arylsulfatase [Candidatus Eremiobacteraeota bacterium]|nr:arylsulfatase [Candidatus Eremiobacteraeota bacterium]